MVIGEPSTITKRIAQSVENAQTLPGALEKATFKCTFNYADNVFAIFKSNYALNGRLP